MARKLRRLACIAAAMCLSACTSGMVLGGKASCTGSTVLLTQVTGECSRTIDELDEPETQHVAVQTADVSPFATVAFEVTVDQGTVAVIVKDKNGDEQTMEATATSPARGSVRVQLDPLSQINFQLAPVGGPTRGVKYHLKFVCDCMP